LPFIDARRLDNSRNQSDLCIVGAGAAGITLACELETTGLSIALLESGDIGFRHRPQLLYHGENVGLPNFATAKSRFRTFGGSTTRWGGQCRPFDPIDFEARPWIRHSGWPISYASLKPYYCRAAVVCELAQPDFDLAPWFTTNAGVTPVRSSILETRIYQFSQARDFGVRHRDRLAHARNVQVYLNANVTEIITNGSGSEVICLRCRTFNGRESRFSARAYVLACGGIENARLMLASRNVAPCGVGNSTDLVGRFFADHPYFLLGHFEPREPGFADSDYVIREGYGRAQRVHAAFGLREAEQRKEQVNGACVYLIRRADYKTRPAHSTHWSMSYATATCLTGVSPCICEVRLPARMTSR
jgi:choline dehydrogenase-like flavoprotein